MQRILTGAKANTNRDKESVHQEDITIKLYKGHNGIKLEVNNRERSRNCPNIWKQNNTLLNKA